MTNEEAVRIMIAHQRALEDDTANNGMTVLQIKKKMRHVKSKH